MTKLKTVRAAVAAAVLSLPGFAAADIITFDTNGAAAGGQLNNVAVFDWAPGSALAVGSIPTAVGNSFQLLYQANLAAILDQAGNPIYAPIAGQPNFTAVAGFGETVTGLNTVGPNQTATFGLNTSPQFQNFFRICAQGPGNNLAGTGFACGTPILTGTIVELLSSNYTSSIGTEVPLDQSPNGNQWGDQLTQVGSGATDIRVRIDSANAAYFPTLASGGTFGFSFFNTSTVDPFRQVDPSQRFSSNGVADGDVLAIGTLGRVNGVNGPNFILQADANQSFVVGKVPEPGSLALLGGALLGLGALRRRKAQ